MPNNEFSNAEKLKHGITANKSLEQILISEQRNGFLKSVIKDYSATKANYKNSVFSAHFLIEFEDGTQWILYSTSSYRSDRLKEQQWEASNCKEINKNIKKAYLICPDTIKTTEQNSIKNVSEEITKGYRFSAIDSIIIQSDLRKLIESKALESKTKAQAKDIQGKAFEKRIADIMNDTNNLIKFKTNDRAIEGANYNTFLLLVNLFKLNKNNIETIVATADKKKIGLLPSGGSPKTDVIIYVINKKGHQIPFTISCKRSSENKVTVHQYSAKEFSNVLNPNDEELLYLLNEFQKCGGIQQFGKENTENLTAKLKPYIKKLTMWVLGGIGGQSNSEIQCANYIVVYKNTTDEIKAYPLQEYANIIMQNSNGHFGTPFTWTYASGSKGKNIQLKSII